MRTCCQKVIYIYSMYFRLLDLSIMTSSDTKENLDPGSINLQFKDAALARIIRGVNEEFSLVAKVQAFVVFK